jgi:hypothetical protein
MYLSSSSFAVSLTEAVATTQPTVEVDYKTTTAQTPVLEVTTTNNTTTVTLATATSDNPIIIQYVNLLNTDTIAHTVKFYQVTGSATFVVYQKQIQPGDTIQWTSTAGWGPTAGPQGPAGPSGPAIVYCGLFGLTLANDGATPASVIDIAPGVATDSTNAVAMTLASQVNKNLAATWAAGSNAGGLDTGSKAISTWYHVYLIQNPTTTAVDALFSLSPNAPTLPSGYTSFRRLGSVRTDGSGNIIAFTQLGDTYLWMTPSQDINQTTLSTTGALSTMLVPMGVKVEGIFQPLLSGDLICNVAITSPDINNYAPGGTLETLAIAQSSVNSVCEIRVRTNTMSQIRTRSTSATGTGLVFSVYTLGWNDTRGRLY